MRRQEPSKIYDGNELMAHGWFIGIDRQGETVLMQIKQDGEGNWEVGKSSWWYKPGKAEREASCRIEGIPTDLSRREEALERTSKAAIERSQGIAQPAEKEDGAEASEKAHLRFERHIRLSKAGFDVAVSRARDHAQWAQDRYLKDLERAQAAEEGPS